MSNSVFWGKNVIILLPAEYMSVAIVFFVTCFVFNSYPTSGDFCRLLITFANSLDQDQARQNSRPDLDPNCLTLWWYSWKIFCTKVNLKKKKKKNPQTTKKSMQNYPTCKAWNVLLFALTHIYPAFANSVILKKPTDWICTVCHSVCEFSSTIWIK